jgi:hypothetical protein
MLARTSFWPIGMVMHFVLADDIASRTYLLLIFGTVPFCTSVAFAPAGKLSFSRKA